MMNIETDLAKRSRNYKVIPKNVFAELQETYFISDEQKKFYDKNGYLIIKELIDFGTLYSCKQRFIDICKNMDRKDKTKLSSVFIEKSMLNKGLKGENLVNKLQDILHDEVFSLYTENPRLLHVVSQFIGDNLMGIQSMLINKPPGTGRHPPHQDLYYFPIRPADKIIAAWTAVDHVTVDNGCLYVVPGSHRADTLHDHAVKPDASKLYHGLRDEDVAPLQKRAHLEMSPGDTVFFHPLIIHGSGPNVTKGYRKALTCHYASCECQYVPPTGTQTIMAREIEEEMAKFGIQEPSVIDLYRHYKSKLVKGVRSNL